VDGLLKLRSVLCLLLLGATACTEVALTSTELRLPARNLQVTAENRTTEDRALWFSASTLDARSPVPACRTTVVVYAPEPGPGGFPRLPESWALVAGSATEAGDFGVGLKGPFATIASSADGPLQPSTSGVFIVFEDDDVRWRLQSPDEARDAREADAGC
jgi:hypothetical protein